MDDGWYTPVFWHEILEDTMNELLYIDGRELVIAKERRRKNKNKWLLADDLI